MVPDACAAHVDVEVGVTPANTHETIFLYLQQSPAGRSVPQRFTHKTHTHTHRKGKKVRKKHIIKHAMVIILNFAQQFILTMRQPGLGKHEWIIEDQTMAAAGGE